MPERTTGLDAVIATEERLQRTRFTKVLKETGRTHIRTRREPQHFDDAGTWEDIELRYRWTTSTTYIVPDSAPYAGHITLRRPGFTYISKQAGSPFGNGPGDAGPLRSH